MKGYQTRVAPDEVPSSCEALSSELLTLKWVHNSLRETERMPSCSRKTALVSALTVLLETPRLPDIRSLQVDLQKAESTIRHLNTVVESAKSDCVLWESSDSQVCEFSSEIQHTIRKWVLVHVKPYFFKGLLTGTVLGAIVTLLFHRFIL